MVNRAAHYHPNGPNSHIAWSQPGAFRGWGSARMMNSTRG